MYAIRSYYVALFQQTVAVLIALIELIPLLIQIELGQPQVGNPLFQIPRQFGVRQHLALLVENTRQQQAALEHGDLLVEIALHLRDPLQPALYLDVLLHQVVDLRNNFV